MKTLHLFSGEQTPEKDVTLEKERGKEGKKKRERSQRVQLARNVLLRYAELGEQWPIVSHSKVVRATGVRCYRGLRGLQHEVRSIIFFCFSTFVPRGTINSFDENGKSEYGLGVVPTLIKT